MIECNWVIECNLYGKLSTCRTPEKSGTNSYFFCFKLRFYNSLSGCLKTKNRNELHSIAWNFELHSLIFLVAATPVQKGQEHIFFSRFCICTAKVHVILWPLPEIPVPPLPKSHPSPLINWHCSIDFARPQGSASTLLCRCRLPPPPPSLLRRALFIA